jgi:hypothetical protein
VRCKLVTSLSWLNLKYKRTWLTYRGIFSQTRIVEPEKQPLQANGSETTFVSKQRPRNKQRKCLLLGRRFLKTIAKKTVFSVGFVPKFYNRDGWEQQSQCSVETQAVRRHYV